MEKPIDFWLRTEGTVGNVVPTIELPRTLLSEHSYVFPTYSLFFFEFAISIIPLLSSAAPSIAR